MKIRSPKNPRFFEILLPVLVLLVCIAAMHFSAPKVYQASLPVPMKQGFIGEYSWDQENWYPLDEDVKLSAFDGDLYLRGHWEKDMPAKTRVYFFSDHIGSEIYIDGERSNMSIVLDLARYGIELQPSMCYKGWNCMYFDEALTSDSQLLIHLTNPHSFGNKNAYMDFLNTLLSTDNSDEMVKEYLKDGSMIPTVAGIMLIIAAVMLLGVAIAALSLKVPVGYTLAKFGLLAGFAGGYFIFDTNAVSFWSSNNTLNTYGYQICMMYAVYMLGLVEKDLLVGNTRTMASAALAVSALVNGIIVILSMTGAVLIYDTLVFWVASQLILCPLLIVCCIKDLPGLSKANKISAFFLMSIFACIILDILWVSDARGFDGTMTKIVFLASFTYIFFRSARGTVANYMAAIKAMKLEKELEESRISVMLSQIQPHFMFNVLGTLRGLCREDPEQAWVGLGDFSTYLRGNMNALTNARFIPFDTELQHVETYLRLEKMRLGEKLSIVYDIETRDFMLPPLSLQPLVENAVKHGIFYKKDGGTVIIHSGREDGDIVISVHDDGVGFDTSRAANPLEQHANVGIENVRKRIENMLQGSLRVESVKDKGTTVTVRFPADVKIQEGAQF